MLTRLSELKTTPVKMHSGFDFKFHPSIRPLREGFFCKDPRSVSGDAPKDFLRVYEFGCGRKANPKTWPAHIAKVGHKYYPIESVTEHLLTRIGQLLELKIAESRLMWVRGQLRFLSRYFLRSCESLIHGAEIFSGYLNKDRDFVLQVEELKMSNEIFTFQVVEAATTAMFPQQADAIMRDFVRLLAFDAIVGNNDRHFFNWGVITHITGKTAPQLSPIYDTARALFWNRDEAGLLKHEHNFEDHLKKYSAESVPKTGWDSCSGLNHFGLIERIAAYRENYRKTLTEIPVKGLVERVEAVMDEEFAELMSPLRKRFVLGCLRLRLGMFAEIVTKSKRDA